MCLRCWETRKRNTMSELAVEYALNAGHSSLAVFFWDSFRVACIRGDSELLLATRDKHDLAYRYRSG